MTGARPHLIYQKYGDWEGNIRTFEKLSQNFKVALVSAQRREAFAIKKRLLDHVNAQDLGWPERQPKTISGDSRILVDTGQLISAIQVHTLGSGMTVLVGILKGISHNKSRADLVDIMSYHEYGTINMVERPLFTPTLAEIGGPEGIKLRLVAALSAYFYKVTRGSDWKLEIL
jgi:hypothetical protein